MSEVGAMGVAGAAAEIPEPELSVVGARADLGAASPTVIFSLRARDPSEREIYSIALSVQILIDPAGRGYDEPTREALSDLFGPADGMAANLQTLVWGRADVLAPSFTSEAIFELPIACTYDLEVASAKYFDSLPGGVAPLDFQFNGTIFYRGEHDRLQIVHVPWSSVARYRMPASVWREAVDAQFAETGWVRLHRDTLAALRRRKTQRGAHSLDAVVAELLDGES